jgi:hypothetical protein
MMTLHLQVYLLCQRFISMDELQLLLLRCLCSSDFEQHLLQ